MPQHIGENLIGDIDLHIENSSHYESTKKHYEEEYKSAVENLKNEPHKDELLLKVLITRQEFYNNVERFDSSGAYNAEEFHEDVGNYFADGRSYELDDEGLLTVEESDTKYTFLGVTFNALAAANKIKYDQGDKALSETVQALEHTFLEAGLSLDDFKIYRLKGSDFVVRFENAKVQNLEEISENIKKAHTKTGDIISEKYGGVSPKLINIEANRKDAIEIFNMLQKEIVARGEDPMAFDPDGGVQKYVTGLMLDILEAKREQEFLYSMLDSVAKHTWSLLEKGDVQNAAKAKEFYDLYAARFFSTYEFKNFDSLIPPETADSPRTFYQQLDGKIKRACAELAAERVFGAREEKHYVSDILTKLSLDKLAAGTAADDVIRDKVFAELVSQEFDSSEFSLFQHTGVDITLETFTRKYQTVQKKQISYARIALGNVFYIVADGIVDDTEHATLQNSIRAYSDYLKKSGEDYFDSTVQLGGVNYDLQNILTQNTNEWSIEKVNLAKDLFTSVMGTHAKRYDMQTGLPKKEMFFRKNDEMVLQALLNGEDMTYVIGDLAYLRYANEAGRATGNAAINVTAYSFERAAGAVECDSIIARFGGDEFVGLLKGKVPNIYEVEANFANTFLEASRVHNVPAAKETDNYIPHTVNLNLGFCSLEWGFRGIEDLIAAGAFGEEDALALTNVLDLAKNKEAKNANPEELKYFSTILSKTMSRIAEKSMEVNKAKQRALYLYGMYERLEEYEVPENTKPRKTFNTIFSYSQKAMPDVSITDFSHLYDEIHDNIDVTPEQKELAITTRFGQYEESPEASHYESILKDIVAEYIKT